MLNEFLREVGGKLILSCNFDISKLFLYIPAFYIECLYAWSELMFKAVNSYEDVIIIQNKSIFNEHLFLLGVVKIGDLISKTEVFCKA